MQRPHVSEPFIGAVSGKPMLMMLVPRRDEQGRYAGFLGGLVEIDGSELFEGIERLRLGDAGHVVVATAAGRLLYHPKQRHGMPDITEAKNAPRLDLALLGWEGEARGKVRQGGEALKAYRQIWPADWVVALYLPLDQVYAPLANVMERITRQAWWALGLLLFDLDHFKPINDKGGHALGDRMLQQVAAARGAETRSSDHAARQGGDEFAMLLPGGKLPQAMRIAEALRTRIETEGLEHEGNTWRVTVSIGVSAFYPTDHSAGNVVTRADAASYDAKSQGRNAVVSA